MGPDPIDRRDRHRSDRTRAMLATMRRLGSTCLLALACLGSAPATWCGEPLWARVGFTTRVRIKLLERGAAPHAPLRYKFVTGRREIGTVEVEEGRAATRVPDQDSRASAQITALAEQVSSTGEAKFRFVFDAFQSTESGLQRRREVLATWDGTSQRFAIDARGVTKGKTEPDQAAEAQNVPGLLEAISVLNEVHAPYFPAEAVGVGARWEVFGKPSSGWDEEERTTCTLQARAGDRVTIHVTLARSAESGQKRRDGDIDWLLQSHAGTGTGTYELDLTCVLPVRATMSVSERTRLSLSLRNPSFESQSDHQSRWAITISGAVAQEETPR